MSRIDLRAAALLLAGPAFGQQTPPEGWGGGVNCTIRPLQVVEIAAPVNGIIAEVKVKPGARVKAGDVIALFDSAIAAADLAHAEARAANTSGVEIARTRLEGLQRKAARIERARAARAVPASDLDAALLERDLAARDLSRAEAELKLARLEADRARIVLEKGVVRSPVSGAVGEGLIGPGEAPGVEQPIARITVTEPLRVEAYVPTSELPQFLAQAEHHASIAGKTYPLVRDYVAAEADLSSNTLSVFFNLSADDVLPGYDCRIETAPTSGG